ncbi:MULTISPECIES: DUF3073 domain-containing protein [Corynebacterium]|jgi:hypothetical protein|uniref:DUF3073 domain-containing protein n=1 Tax=Corynebacterium provencense TaxID=1737425 RepID=A0A2Z3YWH0_9CORY|nr:MULTISPECIES: DUF3073 domain-containing protein [Corynebacterium]AWT26914.1 hypothetical protein Csp1_21610 [Corynebacterium provencense]MCI1255088.1 DUF3073 domain-containing protein [Corynebacterium provencense]
MGRGRAKAKQTKVARQLKYNSPEMDLDSLQRELSGEHRHDAVSEDDYTRWEEWGPDNSGR